MKYLIGMVCALSITWAPLALAKAETGKGTSLKVQGKPLFEAVPGEFKIKVHIKTDLHKKSKTVTLTTDQWKWVFDHREDIEAQFDSSRGNIAR